MGSASDAQIYNVSELKECVEDGILGFPDPEPLPHDNLDVPYFFVGDDAFALRPDMIEPFSLRGMTRPFAGCALSARCMRAACALHARCMRAACALHARCMRAACALHAHCMRGTRAGHSFSAPATRCALVDFFKTCALYAHCIRPAR